MDLFDGAFMKKTILLAALAIVTVAIFALGVLAPSAFACSGPGC
jgi:hypothetical protein